MVPEDVTDMVVTSLSHGSASRFRRLQDGTTGVSVTYTLNVYDDTVTVEVIGSTLAEAISNGLFVQELADA
ncbi:hypothetical protein EON65_05495, partial [archaeon]